MASTPKTTSVIKTKKFDIDIGIEILRILKEREHIKESDLLKELIAKYSNGYIGASARNIRRIIHNLEKHKEIIILKKAEREEYGINDKDGRAAYLILKEAEQTRGLLTEAFKIVDSKNKAERRMGLLELESNKYVTFSPEQIDRLVQCIRDDDFDENYQVTRILYHQMIHKHARPKNEEQFKLILHKVVKKLSSKTTPSANTKSEIISILGQIDDPFIIEQLEADLIANVDAEILRARYANYMTAKTIDKHKKELFTLQLKFMKMKQEAKALCIQGIRNDAIQTIKAYNGEGWDGKVI